MKTFFKKHKIETFLFLGSFLLGLSAFFALHIWENQVGHFSDLPNYSFPVMADDSPGYFDLAQNIIIRGDFAAIGDPNLAESFRTPGYPSFVALVLLLFNNVNFIAIVQIALAALSVVLLYKITSLFFSKKVSILASLLLMVEPSAIYYSNLVLTDSFFVFLLLLIIYLFIQSPKSAKHELLLKFSAGLLLSFAILVRPIGQYIAVLLFFYFVVYYFKKFSKQKLATILLFVIGVLLLSVPWSLRNKSIFDTYVLSTASTLVLHDYTLPMHYADEHNITIVEARQVFDAQVNKTGDRPYDTSLFIEPELKNASLKYLKENFVSYLKFHLIKTLPIFFTDGMRDILYQVKANTSGMPNISSLIVNGEFKELSEQLSKSKINVILFVIGVLSWIIINLLALIGLIRLLFHSPRKRFYFVVLSTMLILYFSMVTGPIANSRYRLPFEPFIFILASYGFYYILAKIKKTKHA